MSGHSELARQWVEKARNDLLCADNNLTAAKIPYDAVCFHCQQAAEKLLKAFLVFHHQRHSITHDLLLLLEEIAPTSPNIEDLRETLIILLPYAVEVRYPGDRWMPTHEDALEARQAVQTVLDWLKKNQSELL